VGTWGFRGIVKFCVSVNCFDTVRVYICVCTYMWLDIFTYDVSYENHPGQGKQNKAMFALLGAVEYWMVKCVYR